MATWTKMGEVPNPVPDANGDPYSGAVLKVYDPGTTTAVSIATNAAGTTTVASMTSNAAGKWEVSGNEVIPHIDRKCKWGIFANSTDATANTPFYMGPFDNVEQAVGGSFSGGVTSGVSQVDSITDLKAITSPSGIVLVAYHTAENDKGGDPFRWDSADTTTDDGGKYIQPDAGGVGRWIRDVGIEHLTTAHYNNDHVSALATVAVSGGTLIINTAVVVTATANWPQNVKIVVENTGSITVNTGVTLTLQGDFEAGLHQVFTYVGTGVVKFSSFKCPVLHPEWWGLKADNLSASSTTNKTALEACNAAFTDVGAANQYGGTIQLPHGSIYIDSWEFIGGDRTVKGHGIYATRFIGVGAGDFVLEVFDSGRCHFQDFGIDGNSVKKRALEIASTVGAGAGGIQFETIGLYGATEDGFYIDGGPPDIHDISSIVFINSQFICSGATSSQIFLTGDNTIAISFFNCDIYGVSDIGVKNAGSTNFYDCNFANNAQWNIQSIAASQSSGQIKCYGCHSEGTGGFINTLSSDIAGNQSSQHVIDGHSGSNTGANTSNVAIKHEAFRTMAIRNSFFNKNIEIDSGVGGKGVLDVSNNEFESGFGYVLTEGYIRGTHEGDTIVGAGKSVTFDVELAYQGSVGATSTDVLSNTQVTALSASDVNISSNPAGIYIIHDMFAGAYAYVWHVGGTTPVIMQSTGAVWVTGAPAATEIQIKDRGAGNGISVLAGASKNNVTINVSRMTIK